MSTPKLRPAPTAPFTHTAKCEDTPSCARDRIFQAAKNLFYRYGIRGVSVDTIAAEAETTKVTLYRVFASKDDLVVQVLEDHIQRFWEWWEAVVAPHAGEPRKQLEALFENFKRGICTDEAERGCPVANTAVEIVEDDHPAKKLIHDHEAEIVRRLHALCLELGARRPEQLGDALALLLNGVSAARLLFDDIERMAAAADAAKALIDSPTLGVGAAKKR
jgi:AcrR family transcriptional regulator